MMYQVIKEYKPVQITWIDTVARPGWHNLREISEFGLDTSPYYVQSLGWLVHEDDDNVLLAMSASVYKAAELLRIPKTHIVQRYYLQQVLNAPD